MAVFTFHVFHPKSLGAGIFAGVTITAIVATSAHSLLGGYASIENSYSMLATNAARIVPTAWACYESLRYYRSMRRRQSLGLADPIVANRFLLWSIWTAAVTLLPLVALTIRGIAILTLGNDEFASHANIELLRVMTRVVRIISLVVAPIAAVALSLSFFPPKPISIECDCAATALPSPRHRRHFARTAVAEKASAESCEGPLPLLLAAASLVLETNGR